MTTTPTLTGNQTTKVKRPKEGGICVIFIFFRVLFCGRFFFSPLCFYQAQKVFYHQESNYYLQFKHNRGFLPENERFCHMLDFS
jgi:hypothetical protein